VTLAMLTDTQSTTYNTANTVRPITYCATTVRRAPVLVHVGRSHRSLAGGEIDNLTASLMVTLSRSPATLASTGSNMCCPTSTLFRRLRIEDAGQLSVSQGRAVRARSGQASHQAIVTSSGIRRSGLDRFGDSHSRRSPSSVHALRWPGILENSVRRSSTKHVISARPRASAALKPTGPRQ